MTTHNPSTEELIADALDVVAMGYPIDGTPEEKADYMVALQGLLEQRAPIVREKMLAELLKDD